MVVGDQYAARQNAKRAFEHAHVLIGDEVGNAGAIKKRHDGRHQDLVVGAQDFLHWCPPLAAVSLRRTILSEESATFRDQEPLLIARSYTKSWDHAQAPASPAAAEHATSI